MLSLPILGLTIFPTLGNFCIMKLIDYMTSNSIAPEDMAELIGEVSASGVRKWMSGDRVPRPEQMRKISRVTSGLVQPNDFVLDAREAAE